MKNIFKAWNKGILVFLAVLILAGTTEIILAVQRTDQTEELTELMNRYFAAESELYVLPEQYKTVSEQGVKYLGYSDAQAALSPYYTEESCGYNASASLVACVWAKQLDEACVVTSFHCNVVSLTITKEKNNTVRAVVKYRTRFEGSAEMLGIIMSEKQNNASDGSGTQGGGGSLTDAGTGLSYDSADSTQPWRGVYEQEVTFCKEASGWKLVSFGGPEFFYGCYDGGIVPHLPEV